MSVVTFILITLIIFTLTPRSVQGEFTEDFSDSALSGWTTYGTDGNISTWDVQDGSLESTGTLDDYNDHNFACHRTDVDLDSSYWSFRIFGNEDRWRLGFRISEFPVLAEDDTYYLNPSHVQVVVSAGVDPNGNPSTLQTSISQHTFGGGWTTLGEITPTDSQLRGWHNYTIAINDTMISVYEDNEFLLVGELRNIGFIFYDSICLWSEEGSGVKVDDIKVGPLVDISDMLLPSNTESDSTTSSNNSSNEGDTLFPYFVIGTGLLTATSAVFFTGRIIKKKD